MNLGQLWTILWRARWTIVLMIVVGTTVAWRVSSSLPKQYQAKARVLLDVGDEDPNHYSSLKKDTEASYIATEARLVTSDEVLRDVAVKLGWPDDPTVVTAWQTATGGQGDVALWAAHRLAGNINVQQFGDGDILEIYYIAESPDVAKVLAATIRTAYIDNGQRLRSAAARRAAAWNQTEAARAYVELQKAEAAKVKFLNANQIPVDTSNDGLEMQAMTQLQTAAASATGRTTGVVVTPMMERLKRQLSELEVKVAILQQTGEDNPETKAAELARDETRQQLDRETSFARAGETATATQIEANRQLRNNIYLAARLRILDRAPLFDQLAQLDREVRLRTTLYTAAERRAKDFDGVAAAPSSTRVLGDVIVDDDPVFPNIPLSVGLAGALSLGLGIALALFGEMLRRQVRGTEDLRFFGQVPVLAVIPADPRQRRRWSWRGRWPTLVPGS